jgi:uncharacterized damage-inducible protein DinB
VVGLPQDQFIQNVAYSVGSVRNQVVHMLNIDDRWFSGLRGEEVPGFRNPVHYTNRDKIRRLWDDIEEKMRDYLGTLTDDKLSTQPFLEVINDLMQLLIHVANHGTDHRAQVLALLNQQGVETFPQDFVFYVKGRF